jgi:hypothetical protein
MSGANLSDDDIRSRKRSFESAIENDKRGDVTSSARKRSYIPQLEKRANS